jgi:hypothetical protein
MAFFQSEYSYGFSVFVGNGNVYYKRHTRGAFPLREFVYGFSVKKKYQDAAYKHNIQIAYFLCGLRHDVANSFCKSIVFRSHSKNR